MASRAARLPAGLKVACTWKFAVLLAWVFAASRIVHAVIHIGPNVVMWRGVAFIFGAVVLLAMWLLLGWRVWAGA